MNTDQKLSCLREENYKAMGPVAFLEYPSPNISALPTNQCPDRILLDQEIAENLVDNVPFSMEENSLWLNARHFLDSWPETHQLETSLYTELVDPGSGRGFTSRASQGEGYNYQTEAIYSSLDFSNSKFTPQSREEDKKSGISETNSFTLSQPIPWSDIDPRISTLIEKIINSETKLPAIQELLDYLETRRQYKKGLTTSGEDITSVAESLLHVSNCAGSNMLGVDILTQAGLKARYVTGIMADGQRNAWTKAIINGEWHIFDFTPTVKKPGARNFSYVPAPTKPTEFKVHTGRNKVNRVSYSYGGRAASVPRPINSPSYVPLEPTTASKPLAELPPPPPTTYHRSREVYIPREPSGSYFRRVMWNLGDPEGNVRCVP